jgi:hypothetical protein
VAEIEVVGAVGTDELSRRRERQLDDAEQHEASVEVANPLGLEAGLHRCEPPSRTKRPWSVGP